MNTGNSPFSVPKTCNNGKAGLTVDELRVDLFELADHIGHLEQEGGRPDVAGQQVRVAVDAVQPQTRHQVLCPAAGEGRVILGAGAEGLLFDSNESPHLRPASLFFSNVRAEQKRSNLL